MDIQRIMYESVKNIISAWNEDGIYAVSFLVTSNECLEYNGFKNVSSFAIGYNCESDCQGAGIYDEERWNYAFWRQNEQYVINPDEPDALIELLFEWYKSEGVTNIGYEDEESGYDEDFNYVGKGPVGHYELLNIVADVAERLQNEGLLENRFGRKIPIIVHGMEYAWYDIEATKKANPNGEAETFLKALEMLEII